MNNLKKVFSVVLIVVTLLSVMSLGVVANASTPAAQTIQAAPGETVTLKLSESDCYGISGSITYSNRGLFSSVTPGSSPYGMIREGSFILSSAEKVECAVTLSAKISDSAAVGSTCVVSFTDYLRVDNNITLEGPDGLVKTVTVQVIEKKQEEPQPEDPKPEDPKPEDPKPEDPKPEDTNKPSGNDTPAGTTPQKPSDGKVDLTALNKQIGIAESLNEKEYTADTWAKMQSALAAAKAARKESSQAAIDTATKNLKNAIANLLRLDNEELATLIKDAKEFLEKDELKALSDKLAAAIKDAESALKSGNQEKIAAASAALKDALAAYKAKLEELGKGELIGVDTPVEVPPSDDYCNIWLHKLWLILLIVSFIINLGFAGLTVYYFMRRKQNLTDDTPLVDYEIDDD